MERKQNGNANYPAPLREIFDEVSSVVELRDKFLAENATTLAKWQALENEVGLKRFWANEKIDWLLERGDLKAGELENIEMIQDDYIEMKVKRSGDEDALDTPKFAIDFFEKVRYNQGKN